MILGAVLLISFFNHKHPKQPSPEQVAHAKLMAVDRKVVLNAITGAREFEADKKMVQYERVALDAFEHQIYVCVYDTDDQLDKDVDLLIELGGELMAVDKALEKDNAI